MFNQKFLSSLVILVVTLNSFCYSALPNAIIYENSENDLMELSYHHDTAAFHDIPLALSVHNMSKVGKVCFTGPFMIYPLPGFQTTDVNNLQLIMTSVLDPLFCITPKTDVGSMQLITDFSYSTHFVFWAFPDINFQGQGKKLAQYDFGQTFGRVRSFLLTSLPAYEVLSKSSNRFCVLNTVSEPDPGEFISANTCFMSDATTAFNGDTAIQSILGLGCSDESKLNTVVLTSCQSSKQGLYEMGAILKRSNGQ